MSLVWSPIIDQIAAQSQVANPLACCVSAFTTVPAIEELLRYVDNRQFFVITRWRVSDLISGASNLGVFELLDSQRIPLYINYRLHAKIFQFRDRSMLVGSSNATCRGLGMLAESDCNIEVSSFVQDVGLHDEHELRLLRDNCIRVDSDVVRAFQAAIRELPDNSAKSELDFAIYSQFLSRRRFLLSDLPSVNCPRTLIDTLLQHDGPICALPPKVLFDCITLHINERMSEKDLESHIRQYFTGNLFVRFVVNEIRRNGSMSFGAVTSLVHTHCRDVPCPNRGDVKICVQNLYNWLVYFFQDLTWYVPGQRSQVIRSNGRF